MATNANPTPTRIQGDKAFPLQVTVASQNHDYPVLGAKSVVVQVPAVGSTANHILYVSYNGGDTWSTCVANTQDGRRYELGATIAFTAGIALRVNTDGATHFRIATQSSSTATVGVIALANAQTWPPFKFESSGGAYTFPVNGFSVSATPAISASPDYTALDVAGGITTFTGVAAVSGRPVRLDTLTVTDKAGQLPQFTIMFFKATPSGGTYTDNGALTLGSGDLANFVGHVKVVTGDYYTPVSGSSVATISGINMTIPISATSLFALIIVDAAWNAGSTTDVIITIGGERL